MRRVVGWIPVALGVVLFLSGPSANAKPARNASSAAKTVVAKASQGAKTSQGKKTKKSGVKTITFGAQQVEGRLRSPQILYFLRRVRAQFAPRPLGHRSFLLELADTRRSHALR